MKNKMVLDRNKGNVPTGPADVIGHVGGGAALQEALSWAHEPKVALSSARVFLANLGTVAPPTRRAQRQRTHVFPAAPGPAFCAPGSELPYRVVSG